MEVTMKKWFFLMLLLVILRPVVDMDMGAFALSYDDYEREIQALTEEYRQSASRELTSLIEEKTAAYIASKGAELGLDCTAQVETELREGVPYPSLSDFFHDRGLPVGVVTLGNIADATPTAFYGHSVERDNADELTRCLMDGRIDLLCGSGIREFTRRKDGIDLVGELEKQYDFVRSVDGIDAAKGKVICIDEAMDDAAEEANLTLLADATRASIAKLQERGGDGFFLMVEGAKIDYAGHSRCLPGSIIEMLSFDLAVAEALKFADTNGETLVIVTADHETGGLVVVDGDEHTGRVTGVYVSDDHTPAMLPVFAYGPGADKFCGTYMNTEIARRIKSLIK